MQGQQIEKTGRGGGEKPDENGRLGAAVIGELTGPEPGQERGGELRAGD
jgi:hypothetical protein